MQWYLGDKLHLDTFKLNTIDAIYTTLLLNRDFTLNSSWQFYGLSNKIQYNTISFIADEKNKDREVSGDTTTTETYYMMGNGINKIYNKTN